jgi:hypothetical protein
MGLESGNLPQDPSVRFLSGGDSMAFEISSGQTRAVFPGEPNPNTARYQTGTVAGAIRFFVSQLETSGGAAVPIADGPEVGSTEVRYLPPAFVESLDCARTTAGISLSLKAYSTPRNVTGVDLNLSPAPNTELNFTKPPETFANEFFNSWFADANNNGYGGAFMLTIPISISDMRALGGASVRLRNEVGWSDSSQIQASGCQ